MNDVDFFMLGLALYCFALTWALVRQSDKLKTLQWKLGIFSSRLQKHDRALQKAKMIDKSGDCDHV